MLPYLHALGADFHARAVGKGRPLEIGVFAIFSCGGEFCRAGAVRIAAGVYRSFIAGGTGFCHKYIFLP